MQFCERKKADSGFQGSLMRRKRAITNHNIDIARKVAADIEPDPPGKIVEVVNIWPVAVWTTASEFRALVWIINRKSETWLTSTLP